MVSLCLLLGVEPSQHTKPTHCLIRLDSRATSTHFPFNLFSDLKGSKTQFQTLSGLTWKSKRPATPSEIMKGWFDAFRDDGAPTLYSFSNRTPVTGDVSIVAVTVLFATLYIAFLVIFPGVRKQVSKSTGRMTLNDLKPNSSSSA